MSAEKFNAKSASLSEINRELKRLASRKCRAKTDEERKSAADAYEKLVKIKNERFHTSRKSYFTMSDEEIASCDLETAVKAIKSLQSRRCIYPEKRAETMEVELKFRARRDELTERAQLEKLAAKYK